jgi:hypothetical protein
VSLKPVTGRQHQLGAHMALIGNPIVGDNKYEGDKVLADSGIEPKLHLHARRLVIPHPPVATSTSRRRCPTTCARRGRCWAWMRHASMRTRTTRTPAAALGRPQASPSAFSQRTAVRKASSVWATSRAPCVADTKAARRAHDVDPLASRATRRR